VTHRNLIALAAIALLALASNAMATDVTYYTGSIWRGHNAGVGTVTATMHCSSSDTTLEIAYNTTDGWRMRECNLWIKKSCRPSCRGNTGQYAYKCGSIDTTCHSFSIPIADLRRKFGIDWGKDVYVMPYCDVYKDGNNNHHHDSGEGHQCGFGGRHCQPKRGDWYGFCCFKCTKPQEEPREPYCGGTMTCTYWYNFWSPDSVAEQSWHTDQDVLDYLGDGSAVTDGVTLAGTTYKAAADLYAVYDGTGKNYWWYVLNTQIVTLYCNTVMTDGLEDAYYDDPDTTGEFMENKQISYIMGVANGYRLEDNQDGLWYQMFNVLLSINDNSDQNLGVLWDGPAGGFVPLGASARLSVSPNPFTGSARIMSQGTQQSEARVGVYDLSGSKVNELTGFHIVWNGTDASGQKLPAGVYLLKLENGAQPASARAIISR
jgi:hypothetical protein